MSARVLLMGAYGQDNLGDEAILQVHLQQLAGHDVTVVSSDPDQTSARYGVASIRTYGRGWRPRLRAFARSDALVYGGGSLLKELRPPYFRHRLVVNLAAATVAARLTGKRAAFSAMGVERLETRGSRFLARTAADLSDLVLVRDDGSRRRLEAAGARTSALVVADPAYLLETDAEAEAFAERLLAGLPAGPLVVVNAMTSSEVPSPPEAVARAFVGLLDHIHATTHANVLLLPFKTHGADNDVEVLEAIGARCANPGRLGLVREDLRPADVLALLRRAELTVAMRHHAVVLALCARRAVLPIPYAEKTTHLCEEFGLAADSLPADRLEAARAIDAFERAWYGRARQPARTEPPLAAMRLRAEENFRRLRALLEARERPE